MKINNFFEKTPPEPTNRRKITASGVQNVIDSSSVTRLEAEVENLKQKLELSETNLEVTTTKNLKEKEQFSIATRKSKELDEEMAKIREKYDLSLLDVKHLQKEKEKTAVILDELRQQKAEFSSIAPKYQTLQNKFAELEGRFQHTSTKASLLSSTKTLHEDRIRELEGSKQSAVVDLESFKNEYNTMKDALSKTKQNNTGLRKSLNEADRSIQMWKNGFATLEEENTNLTGIKDNLTTWLEQLQGEASNLTGKSSLQGEELQQAKQTIVGMGKTVDDLLDTNSYLRECNNAYLVELSKPRYASIAAISRHEGFKFPSQFIAPKNSLGTSKPTLLKVRKP